MSPNIFCAHINQPPLYVNHLDDCLRVGSFVHAKLWKQEPGTTTICRIKRRTQNGFHLRLFYPLFPLKKNERLPDLPKHHHRPIPFGSPGSLNTELYQSTDFLSVTPGETCDILYPAFVFSVTEIADPKNSWAHGLTNVFVLRFLEQKNDHFRDSSTFLSNLPEDESVCFPNDVTGRLAMDHLVGGKRCYHESVWRGLYLIRKAITKTLNRRTSLAESEELSSLSIGHIPMETFNYLAIVTKESLHSKCQFFYQSESFQDSDYLLTRKKLKFSFKLGVLRFETSSDVEILRQTLGISCTYGSTEHRPRLADGPKGVVLSSGHCVTLVRGRDSQSDELPEEPPFKRLFRGNGVDIAFSPLNTRVTVGYNKYCYRTKRDGSLMHDPPTVHLKNIVEGRVKENYENTMSHKQPPTPDPNAPLDIGISIGDIYDKEGTIYKVIQISRHQETELHEITSRVIAGKLYDNDNPPKHQSVDKTLSHEDILELINAYN